MSLERGTYGSPVLWFSAIYASTSFEVLPGKSGKGFARRGEAAGEPARLPRPPLVFPGHAGVARTAPPRRPRAVRRVRQRRSPAPWRRLSAAGARARLRQAARQGGSARGAPVALHL